MAQDSALAAAWCAKAAAQGDAKAQFYLSICFKEGVGVAQDASLALKWFRKAAAQGDKESAAEIARALLPPLGAHLETSVLCAK